MVLAIFHICGNTYASLQLFSAFASHSLLSIISKFALLIRTIYKKAYGFLAGIHWQHQSTCWEPYTGKWACGSNFQPREPQQGLVALLMGGLITQSSKLLGHMNLNGANLHYLKQVPYRFSTERADSDVHSFAHVDYVSAMEGMGTLQHSGYPCVHLNYKGHHSKKNPQKPNGT